MADSISDALLALALDQGRPLPAALSSVAVEGLSHEPHTELFRSLARLLVKQHSLPDPAGNEVYRQTLRDALAGPRGVLAVLDALPQGKDGYETQRLAAFERRFLGWRWRLRDRGERLRSVQVDLSLSRVTILNNREVVVFEPRLQPGDPAADLSAVAVGLIELGAREPLAWIDGYKPLFDAFWSTYLAESGDFELLDVAPPFLAWRALQCASPLAPVAPSPATQRKLFAFAEEVLARRSFDPDEVSRP